MGVNLCPVFFFDTSKWVAVYGMTTESQVSHALERLIVDYGTPYHMRSDNYDIDTVKWWR